MKDRRINGSTNGVVSFPYYSNLVLSFLLCFSHLPSAHATGPHRRRSDRATQQERVCVSNVQCLVRSDRILATVEQGSAARCLAAWRQDQHHLRRGNLGGIR